MKLFGQPLLASGQMVIIKSHLSVLGIKKMAIYKDCLRNPDEPRDFTLCAFVIVLILLPRGGNHAQLITEDVYLIHALKGRIQTD